MCGHVITKFSGMGRYTYRWCYAGALRAPERRYNFSDYSPHPIWLFFSRKNSLAWGVKCEKFNVVALIPIFASINEFIIAKEQSIWLYQILLANISWQCFASYIGLVTFFMYLETTHLSVFHRCSTRSSYNIQQGSSHLSIVPHIWSHCH